MTKNMIKIAIFILLGIAVYQGNILYQSYLGKKAAEAIGISPLSLLEAQSRSQETGKPILVQFSAVWCATCRKLDADVISNSYVRDYIEENYVYSRIEYEDKKQKKYFKKYKISRFPSLLILSPEGNVLRELPLSFDPNQFLKSIQG